MPIEMTLMPWASGGTMRFSASTSGLAGAAEHLRDVGPVDVAVEEADPRALPREGDREVDRGRGLADPALARAHRHDVADAGDLLAAEAAAGADVGRHLRPRRGDAGQRRHERLRLGLHLVLHRAGGRRELDREVDLAALDLDLLHEAEGHDVLVEVGVLHVAQGGENLFLRHAHGIHLEGKASGREGLVDGFLQLLELGRRGCPASW